MKYTFSLFDLESMILLKCDLDIVKNACAQKIKFLDSTISW